MTAREQLEGTLLVVGAAFVFAIIGLVVTVDPLPLLATTQARFAVCWFVSLLFMCRYKTARDLRWFGPEKLRKLVFLKAVLSFTWVTLWWSALRRAPLGNCIAIIYCGPIITSIWSRCLLGERFGRFFPLQGLLVAGGVLLIVDPPFLHPKGAEQAQGDYSFVFAGLMVNSMVPIVTRMTRACSWIEVEHVCGFTACLVLNPSLLLGQYLITGGGLQLPADAFRETALIVTAAFGTFAAVGMETKGYQLAEPGKAAMFRYIEVPFAYCLQLLGTSVPVRLGAVVGSVLVVTSVAISAVEQRRCQRVEAEQPRCQGVEASPAAGPGKQALLSQEAEGSPNARL